MRTGERGRSLTHELISGRSRSRSRDRSSSTHRHQSPARIDTSTGRGSSIHSVALNTPILEGDEDENTDAPMFPVFSSDKGHLPDESLANEVPLQQREEVDHEIESDFTAAYKQEATGVPPSFIPKGSRKRLDREMSSGSESEDDDDSPPHAPTSQLMESSGSSITNNAKNSFYQLSSKATESTSDSRDIEMQSVDLDNQYTHQNEIDAETIVSHRLPKNISEDYLVSPEDDFDERNNVAGIPTKVRPGVASNLMQLYDFTDDDDDYEDIEEAREGSSDDRHRHWHGIKPLFSNVSNASLPRARKAQSSFDLPSFKATQNSKHKVTLRKRMKKKKRPKNEARITVHIADILQRQRFLLKLCKAFMCYGSPNHRLEEYLKSTARVLEVDASFIYLPDMIIVCFGDPSTRTSQVKIVRVNQGLDLAKMDDSHEIYKAVVHDRLGVEEASQQLDDLLARKSEFGTLWLIIFYGLSSMFSLIWFSGGWKDMGPSFLFGCILGFFQLYVAPKSTLYQSVFEVGTSILLSFIGRAIGSIRHGRVFCFSALVQSGLVMILPGYMILSGALEIQSRSMVSGTVKMFYAIIYSLFLGFGITLGEALYGWIDRGAVDTTTCPSTLPSIWNLLFIPAFTVSATLGTQARYKQLPIMTLIACAGYAVYYFTKSYFTGTSFNVALASLAVGLLSNAYSRFGMPFRKLTYCSSAFTSMYPGIIDVVPGSIATKNILKAGLEQLDAIHNGTSSDAESIYKDSTLTFGMNMIEISIGISVGLFLSALLVYPLGKKTTGIFSL